MIGWNADGHIAALLAFASYHVEVIQLFAEIWEQLEPRHVICMNTLDLLLQKLDICLKRLRYSFSGFSREEECHILELTLLAYVLRVYKVGTCSCLILNKLQAAFSRLECLTEEGPLKHSSFYKELKMAYIAQTTTEVPKPFPVPKLLELFSLEQFPLAGGFKHIQAELLVTGNNSENPLLYVSGLPVGITFQITLYNVSNKNTLWLQMAVGQSVQFVFIDLCKFAGSDATRTCTVNLPFYETPKAPSFLLRACICMECEDEVVIECKKGQGPKYDVALLSEEIDVYLAQIRNR